MVKEANFNILDFGSSKIRFSVFNEKLNNIFSKSLPVFIENNYNNHFDQINSIIKIAEKKNKSYLQDLILIFDVTDLFTIDLSLKKNLNTNSKLNNAYELLLLEATQLINKYYHNYSLVHIILDQCIIDNVNFAELPLDKKKEITNLKVDFKILCFPKTTISSIKEGFLKNNLNVTNIFCTSYVKSLSYLRKLNLDNVAFLDIGRSRTSLMAYVKNKLKFIYSIPIGSFNITKDISKIFNISIEDAEKIKKSFNKSDTEFSYKKNENENENENNISVRDIINKKISVDLLKKVILYRVQEIIDLNFKQLKNYNHNLNLEDFELFLIGEGSMLFNNNSFYLNDRFGFKKINYYSETDTEICNSALTHFLNNSKIPRTPRKKQGLFEKFFNLFSK